MGGMSVVVDADVSNSTTLKPIAEAVIKDDAAYSLTPSAHDQLEEWEDLEDVLKSCFQGAVAVFLIGCASGMVLLTAYLTVPAFSRSFKTKQLAERSFTSSFIAVG